MYIWALRRENLPLGVRGQQRRRLCICSLISAFVVRLLESIISKLATREISLFKLVSVAEETGLSLNLSESQKTGFHTARPISCHM